MGRKKKKKSHQYDGRVNSTLLSNGDHKKWHTKKKSKLLFKNVVDTERWKEIFKVCGSDSTLDVVLTAHFTTLWQFASTKQTFFPPQIDPNFLAIGQECNHYSPD